LGNFGGCLSEFKGHFHEILNIFWKPQLKPGQLAPLLGDVIKGGSGCLVIEMHGMPQVGRGRVFRQITATYSKLAVHVLHYAKVA